MENISVKPSAAAVNFFFKNINPFHVACEVSLRIRLKVVPYDPYAARSIHPKWFPRFPVPRNSALIKHLKVTDNDD
jgi:hypothetical protein